MENNVKSPKKIPSKEEMLSEIAEIKLKTKDHFVQLLISQLETELNKYTFGPECDEWEETLDNLDNIRLDSALNAIGFKVNDKGKFKYDFGEDIDHTIKLVEIKELKKDAKYPKI